MGMKVGDVMERTKCGAEGWRRNGKNEVVELKVGDVMERTKYGDEGWRRNGKNKVWGWRLAA